MSADLSSRMLAVLMALPEHIVDPCDWRTFGRTFDALRKRGLIGDSPRGPGVWPTDAGFDLIEKMRAVR